MSHAVLACDFQILKQISVMIAMSGNWPADGEASGRYETLLSLNQGQPIFW
jgi:hypothetical protein